MEKYSYLLFGIFIYFITCSCENKNLDPKTIYNKKANDLIIQTIKKSNCNCLLEIPNKSIIEISNAENSHFDIRNFLIKKLNLKDNANLENLVDLSDSFHIDSETLKKNNIKIVTLDNLKTINLKRGDSILRMCSKGIICIRKPIFNSTFEKAALDFNFAFTCGRGPITIYEFKSGKWNSIKD